MDVEKLTSWVIRIFFLGAFGFLGIAVFDLCLKFFGYTITPVHYTRGRLLEFAVILLLFVIALVLRQVRNELRNSAASAG